MLFISKFLLQCTKYPSLSAGSMRRVWKRSTLTKGQTIPSSAWRMPTKMRKTLTRSNLIQLINAMKNNGDYVVGESSHQEGVVGFPKISSVETATVQRTKTKRLRNKWRQWNINKKCKEEEKNNKSRQGAVSNSMGCKLLNSNTTSIQRVLQKMARRMSRILYWIKIIKATIKVVEESNIRLGHTRNMRTRRGRLLSVIRSPSNPIR